MSREASSNKSRALVLLHGTNLATWLRAVLAGSPAYGKVGTDYVQEKGTARVTGNNTPPGRNKILEHRSVDSAFGNSKLTLRVISKHKSGERVDDHRRSSEKRRDRQQYHQKAGKMFTWVYESLSENIQLKVAHHKERYKDLLVHNDVSGLVTLVKEVCHEDLAGSKEKFRKQLTDFRYKPGKDFVKFRAEFVNLLDLCNEAGCDIDSKSAAVILSRHTLEGTNVWDDPLRACYMHEVNHPDFPTLEECWLLMDQWRKSRGESFFVDRRTGNDADRGPDKAAAVRDPGDNKKKRGRGGEPKGNPLATAGDASKKDTKPKDPDEPPTKQRRLSQEEWEATQRCFNCGETGHIGKNCKKPDKRIKKKKGDTVAAVSAQIVERDDMIDGDIVCGVRHFDVVRSVRSDFGESDGEESDRGSRSPSEYDGGSDDEANPPEEGGNAESTADVYDLTNDDEIDLTGVKVYGVPHKERHDYIHYRYKLNNKDYVFFFEPMKSRYGTLIGCPTGYYRRTAGEAVRYTPLVSPGFSQVRMSLQEEKTMLARRTESQTVLRTIRALGTAATRASSSSNAVVVPERQPRTRDTSSGGSAPAQSSSGANDAKAAVESLVADLVPLVMATAAEVERIGKMSMTKFTNLGTAAEKLGGFAKDHHAAVQTVNEKLQSIGRHQQNSRVTLDGQMHEHAKLLKDHSSALSAIAAKLDEIQKQQGEVRDQMYALHMSMTEDPDAEPAPAKPATAKSKRRSRVEAELPADAQAAETTRKRQAVSTRSTSTQRKEVPAVTRGLAVNPADAFPEAAGETELEGTGRVEYDSAAPPTRPDPEPSRLQAALDSFRGTSTASGVKRKSNATSPATGLFGMYSESEREDGEVDDDGDAVHMAGGDRGTTKYILDSGASAHVFRSTRICPYPSVPVAEGEEYILRTVTDELMCVTHRTNHQGWGVTYVSPDSTTNLLSGPELMTTGHRITLFGTTADIESPNSGVHAYGVLRNGQIELSREAIETLFRATVRAIIPDKGVVTRDGVAGLSHCESYIHTCQATDRVVAVGDSLEKGAEGAPAAATPGTRHYTAEQRARASQVKTLHDFWHVSDQTLKNALSNGLLIGTRLTAHDVEVYREIYGNCPACIMGKRTAPSYRKPSENPPATAVGDIVHTDILPISNSESSYYSYMLAAVDEFSSCLILITLKSKNSNHVNEAFHKLLGLFRKHNHKVKTVVSDSESVLIQSEAFLNNEGCQMFHTPPYQHAQRMERYVRSLKDKSRCLLAGMPYQLPTILYPWLYKAAAFYMNVLPSTTAPTQTPNMLFSHTKFDFAQWVPRIFGTIALMYVAHPKRKEDKMNAESGVILGPCITSVGCYFCYNTHTQRVVRRKFFDSTKGIPESFSWLKNPHYMKILPDLEQNEVTTAPTAAITTDMLSPAAADEPAAGDPPADPPVVSQQPPIATLPVTLTSSVPAETSIVEVTPSREGEYSDDNVIDGDQESNKEIPSPVITENKKKRKVVTQEEVQPARKSQRQHVPSKRWDDGSAAHRGRVEKACSISVKESLKGERAEESKEAIVEEIRNMLTYRVGHYKRFKDIPREKRGNIIMSFMFLKHKENSEGEYTRTKARLVGNGANQKDHLYDLVSSATVGLSSVFMLFNIASYYNTMLCSFDIKGAFLNAAFKAEDEEIYIRINKEVTAIWITIDPSASAYVNEKGELLLQLDKFIYGLKQAPLKFQMHLTQVLKDLGYRQLETDTCLYIRKTESDGFSLISTHVDDILQACTSRALFIELRDGLIKAYGTVTVNEKADEYLGMGIVRSECGRKITLSQHGLIKKVTKEISTKKIGKVTSPAADDLFQLPEDGEEGPGTDKKNFLSLVMSLMYIARLTRPDTLLPVTFLASRSHVATELDMAKCLRVTDYLWKTSETGITVYCTELRVDVWCDASYAIHGDGKGHTGYIVGMGNSYLTSRSAKQKLTATSSTEAELFGQTDAVKAAMYSRDVLSELRLTELQPIRLFQDNKSAIYVISDLGKHRRTKHLITKLSFVRELVLEGTIVPVYLATAKMPADVLTKPLQGSMFIQHRSMLMGLVHLELLESVRTVS